MGLLADHSYIVCSLLEQWTLEKEDEYLKGNYPCGSAGADPDDAFFF